MPGNQERTRTLVLISILGGVGALIAVSFLSCGEDHTRNDALLFLDRYDALDLDDVDAPIEDRRAHLDTLRSLPIGTPDVDRVRDLCVEAGEALIRAEDRGREAREAFDRAIGDGGAEDESSIPTDVRATIESALSESQESLANARRLFPRCMEEERRLRMRFRPQHAHEPN